MRLAETSLDPVNNIAEGGFINEPPGLRKFGARYGSTGPVLGEVDAIVRANSITYIDMYF